MSSKKHKWTPSEWTRKLPRDLRPLRRQFPPLPAEVAVATRALNHRALQDEPRLADLERTLLAQGGHAALLYEINPYRDRIFRAGRFAAGVVVNRLDGRTSATATPRCSTPGRRGPRGSAPATP